MIIKSGNIQSGTTRFAAAVLMAVTACGCGGPSNHPGMPSPNYKMPTPPPKKRDVPLDAGLRRDAEAELVRDFSSTDPILRANVIEATQVTNGATAAPRLIAALTDPAAPVRFAGAMACGSLRVAAARPRLLTMADDRDVSVQVAVRFALHRLGDARLSHDFENLSRDTNARVRANTALALGLLGEPSGLNVLRPMQKDLDRTVRMAVLEAMFRLGDVEARDKLITGTVSINPDEQIVCTLALGGAKKPSDVMRYVRAQLTAETEETRLAAARTAGILGQDEGMSVALKAVDNKDARQRSMAARALGDIGRSDAQDALRPLLKDGDTSVRLAAATAILQLKAG